MPDGDSPGAREANDGGATPLPEGTWLAACSSWGSGPGTSTLRQTSYSQ
jgi:hypothetical protein